MILEVGKLGKAEFVRFIKKTNIFECGENGVVLERENNVYTLYATNAACSVIYAAVPLGTQKELKKHKFVCIAYSRDKMLLDGGDILAMIDYAQRKVAVNKPNLKVFGSEHWGEDVQLPWKSAYNVMFGQPGGEELEMDREAAANFWRWFDAHEVEITEKVSAGGEGAQEMIHQIDRRLCPVFPYEKESDIEFQLGANDGVNEFFMYHFNKPQLKADAEALGEMMPDSLKENWKYITEA